MGEEINFVSSVYTPLHCHDQTWITACSIFFNESASSKCRKCRKGPA